MEKKVYTCSKCFAKSTRWMGKCPSCGEWNTLQEEIIGGKKRGNSESLIVNTAVKIKEVSTENLSRITTNIGEFNRVMGGGIVRDSITILSGAPGGGKSTLALSVCQDLANKGLNVLYASGEESETQIKSRAVRILGENISDNIWIISGDSLDSVVKEVENKDIDFVVIDSIQTFTMAEFLPARAGNPVQTMECANELLRIAKNTDKKRAIIIIGQMNKNEQLAGLRALEHLVDTVLVIDGETEEELRAVTSTKNRFGSTGEIGFFRMTEHGMVSVDNPSEYFITSREHSVSGSALTVIREGTRPIISEIESLVSASFTPYPSRITENMSKDKLNTLLSVLEQKGHIPLNTKNVVVKTLGNIKLKDNASNLAIIMSIVSSVKNQPISNDVVFIGDVGLTGEIKKVPCMESRVKELSRLGFSKVYVSKEVINILPKQDNIEIIYCSTLIDVIQNVFGCGGVENG